jgi:hypothetical protein
MIVHIFRLIDNIKGYGKAMQMERGTNPKRRPNGMASMSATMRLEGVGFTKVGEVRTYRAR